MKEKRIIFCGRFAAAMVGAALAVGMSAASSAQADVGPLGTDFRISNVGTDGDASRSAERPIVGYNPKANNYLVVWAADGLATDEEFEIFGQLMSANGTEIGSDFRISNVGADTDPTRGPGAPAVAYNFATNEYLVTWRADGLATDNEFEIFGQRLSASGAAIGSEFRISNVGIDGDPTHNAFGTAVAYNSTTNEYLVSWEADGLATDSEFEIFGQLISASGTEIGSDFRISTTGADGDANHDARQPTIAYNSATNEYLVSWTADGLATDNEEEIFGQLISASGTEIGSDFRISTTGADGDVDRDAIEPAVAYNPTTNEYLVTWTADGLATEFKFEIFGQRLSANGSKIGSDFRISITGANGDDDRDAFEPAVAYNPTGNEYLVSWNADGLGIDEEFEVFAQRLSATGSDLGSVLRISTTGADGDPTRGASDPTVAYNSTANEYLVSWAADGLATDDELEIFGHRVGELPVAKPPPSPSNEFKLLKLVLNKKHGTATLIVQVPGPGALLLKGKGMKSAKAAAKAAGKLKLAVIPTGKAKRKLAKRGALKLMATVTFTPAGGTAASQARVLRLRKSLRTPKRPTHKAARQG